MSSLDIILCIPLIWGLYKGFVRGLIIQVASILALVLGIYGAVMFSNFAQEFLSATFHIDHKYLAISAFALTFVTIIIGVHFIGRAIKKMIDLMALGFFNKVFGAVFGFLKVALVISVVLFILDLVDEQMGLIPKKERSKSILYGPMSKLVPTIAPDAKKLVNRGKDAILV